MSEYIQWGSVSNDGNGGEKSEFLKLKTGNTYRIRPVLDPVKFYKYFHKHEGKLRTAICDKPDICPVRDKYPDLKKPSLRYAAYVIDRADGKIKILEAPQSVFRPIGSTYESTGKNPGSGTDGSDFQVKVTGTGLATKYEVAWAGSTPLTAEERESLKEALDGDMKKLQKLYKVDSAEKIEEKLFGTDDSEKTEAGTSSFAETSVQESPQPKQAETSSGSDDSDWENNF